jgi:DNA-binding MarR family transcriptional regulator
MQAMTRKSTELDIIDRYLAQWSQVHPTLNIEAMAMSGRAIRSAVYYQRLLAPVLAELALQQWEYDVLASLRRAGGKEGITMSELTSQLLLASGSTTHRVDQLEKRTLVARRQDPHNRRRVYVALTPAGRKLIDRVLPRMNEVLATPFTDLSRADREAIERGQRVLLQALERALQHAP